MERYNNRYDNQQNSTEDDSFNLSMPVTHISPSQGTRKLRYM